VTAAIVIALVIVAPIAATATIRFSQRNRIRSIALVEPSPWAIVLGAPTPPDAPAPVLEDRLLAGVELFRRGRVERLLLTGDDGARRCDEVTVMRRFVLARGVPEDRIQIDRKGLTTLKSLRRAGSEFGIKRAVIVTQGFHLPRALFLAGIFGLEAEGVAADRRRYLGRIAYLRHEWLSTLPAAVLALLKSRTTLR
jgi:SanA protein